MGREHVRPVRRPDEAEALPNHWVHQPEWDSGRRLWSFYFTFADAHALHRTVAMAQDRLHHPGLDLVEPRWLHLTILGTIFTDEINDATFEEMLRAVHGVVASEGPVELVAHPPAIDYDAVCLPVSTSRPLEPLRAQLQEVVSAIVGRDLYALPLPIGGFSPHVTIAYAGPGAPSRHQVESQLSQLVWPDERFEASELSLVELGRADRRWSWDREDRFTLGSGQPSARAGSMARS